MKRNLFWATLLSVALLSCGVKDRGTTSGDGVVSSGDLPAGVWATKNKGYLVRPSITKFPVDIVTVTYQIVDGSLVPISHEGLTFEVDYLMPTMPNMPVTPVVLEPAGAGKLNVTYDISMGGLWEIRLRVFQGGTEIDSLTYQFTVED